MKKKLLSTVLCAALAVTSIAPISAANTQEVASSAYRYKVIEEAQFSNNKIYLYNYNINHGKSIYVDLRTPDTDERKYYINFDFNNNTLTSQTIAKGTYSYLVDGGGNIHDRISFNNTGGSYEKIRIKLCDFSSYFNEDGTHTMTLYDNGTHNYNFTNEGNGYRSSLVCLSGGVFSAVAPDKNGYTYIYVSTKLGQKTYFMTDFAYSTVNSSSSGGGTSGSLLFGLTMGDVDKNGSVNLADAIAIQKSVLNSSEKVFDSLSKRNADVDRNGKINLSDAIKVQKYAIGIK